jgi:TonB family protein
MIVYAMLFTMAMGVPIACAAWAAARVLRRGGRPERAVWLVALLLAFAIPLAMLVGSTSSTIGLLDVLVVSVGGASIAWQAFVLGIWTFLSGTLLLRWARRSHRLRLESRDWMPSSVDGIDVQVTDDVGPTVAGVFRPRILAPAWVVALPGSQRSLFLVHEQEHIRGADPHLVAVARIACVLTPWNPIVWMLSFRLVRAIERDCDRRVVQRSHNSHLQGSTLLEIAARGTSHPIAAATMASVVLGLSLLAGAIDLPVPPVRMKVEVGEAPVPDRAAIMPTFQSQPTRRVAAFVPEWQTRPRTIRYNPPPNRRPPVLLNRRHVRTTLLETYPPELRARGIGGTVYLAVLVGPDGEAVGQRVDRSSGHAALDEAALQMVGDMRFAPARKRDSQSPVWVDQQITFGPGAPDPTRVDHHAVR